MLLFEIKTDKSVELIRRQLRVMEEQEEHSYLLPQEYTDPRVGLHIYTDGNRIKGYYENGERTRTGSLSCFKTWFWAKENTKDGITTVRVFVNLNLFSVLMFIMMFVGIIVGFINGSSVITPGALFGTVIVILLFLSDIKEEWTIYQILHDVYENN